MKTARVAVKLLGGERIVKVFPGELPLEEVYSFVECYDLLFRQMDDITEFHTRQRRWS